MTNKNVMVVGGGVAGLAAALNLAESGIDVEVVAVHPGPVVTRF